MVACLSYHSPQSLSWSLPVIIIIISIFNPPPPAHGINLAKQGKAIGLSSCRVSGDNIVMMSPVDKACVDLSMPTKGMGVM